MLDVVIDGKSALDSRFFLGPVADKEQIFSFIKAYGLDYNDPVGRAELFGNFQEALQFIKRYFLSEDLPHHENLKIPNAILMITDISDLFFKATKSGSKEQLEERLWAEIILKVMHTILHVDKDLRSGYFKDIQTQIFDRFYKYVFRDSEDQLFLGFKKEGAGIPLLEFETKAKKSRVSVIIKLLHKVENVAEELFDRVGIRFVTKTRLDILRVTDFLLKQNIVIPHNIKPSRSINNLIDSQKFKMKHLSALKKSIRENLTEEEFVKSLDEEAKGCIPDGNEKKNEHSSSEYRSIQFTGRQLIKYTNPFYREFKQVRELAKQEDTELSKKLLALDISNIARETMFFYPFEIQILDEETHNNNTEGEASHNEYKKAQVKSAHVRLFKPLLDFYGYKLDFQ